MCLAVHFASRGTQQTKGKPMSSERGGTDIGLGPLQRWRLWLVVGAAVPLGNEVAAPGWVTVAAMAKDCEGRHCPVNESTARCTSAESTVQASAWLVQKAIHVLVLIERRCSVLFWQVGRRNIEL